MKFLALIGLFISINTFAQSYPDNCLDSLDIPSGFSPNGDGTNDKFMILFECPVEDFSIAIYNRWGEEIFASDKYNFVWLGKRDDKDMPVGTYVWTIRYTFNGKATKKTGHITLMR